MSDEKKAGDNKVVQAGNVVNGDVAGRDINHNHFSQKQTYMGALIEKFKKELKSNSKISATVDQLKHYQATNPNVPTEFLGLEKKLELASRQSEVMSAMEKKERFAKRLAMYEFYESAQCIYAFLMGEIEVKFEQHITPLIKAGAEKQVIDSAIEEKVLDPVVKQLEENVLNILKTQW